MMCMAECRKFDEVTTDLNSYASYTTHEKYESFCHALYESARDLQHPDFANISEMVLETIHAMWLLSVIIRFSFAHENPSIVSCNLQIDFRLTLQNLESTDVTLDELCRYVCLANLPGYLE